MKYNYLVIEFHDNDFSRDFIGGLTRFYKDCCENNFFSKTDYDPSERLEQISKKNLLHPLLLNYFIGEIFPNHAEHVVRSHRFYENSK